MPGKFGIKYQWFVILTGVLLFAVSSWFFDTQDIVVYRSIRIGIILFFLVLVLVFHGFRTHPIMIFFLFLLAGSSILALNWEQDEFAIGSLALSTVAYGGVVYGLIRLLSFKYMSSFFGISLLVVAVIMLALMYFFLTMIRETGVSGILHIALWVTGITLFAMCVLSFVYNHELNTRATLIFLLFSLSLLFSEVFRAVGHYELAYGDIPYYLRRALFIVSMYFLYSYSFMEKNDDAPMVRFR